MDIVIGVDIGQKRDPTAVCVAEIHERRNGERSEWHFQVRHLERMPLGTPYPRVADRAGKIVAKVKLKTGSTPRLYVDATGVGKPIVDLLEEKGVNAIACYFNHGDRRVEKSGDEVVIGKAFLVSRLQALLQSERLHLPRTAEAALLRLGGESVHYVLKKRQRQAGLSGITAHLEAGVDVFIVQRLAGHADAVTTARYDRRGAEGQRAAAQFLSISTATAKA